MDNGASSYRRFLEGDDSGLVEIIRDYKDGLIFYLNSLVNNLHIAEELAEDTFVRLGTKKPRDKRKSSFKTWLYTIGRNLVLVTKPGKDVPAEFYLDGKTYAQLTEEYENFIALNQKYGSLVKKGEHLKYGESLYTTGNADGVKWAKELYDERVAFYGTEFLNKYIVNQEFLLELLLTDQEEVFSRLQKAETAFYDARELFRRQFAARELDAFIALGIAAENRQDELLIYVTAAELAELKLKDSSQYMFWLAPRDKEPAEL